MSVNHCSNRAKSAAEDALNNGQQIKERKAGKLCLMTKVFKEKHMESADDQGTQAAFEEKKNP